MTTETVELTATGDAYLQFGVPGLPYSAVRIPLVEDLAEMDAWVARAMNAAQLLAVAYYETFGTESPPEPQQRPARPAGRPSNGRKPVPQRPQVAAGIGAFCPDHPDVEVIPSKAQFAKWEMDEDGNEVQANYFCPGSENGTGRNHNVWRRQLVWPE